MEVAGNVSDEQPNRIRQRALQINADLVAWYRRTGGRGEWFELTDRIVALVESELAAPAPPPKETDE